MSKNKQTQAQAQEIVLTETMSNHAALLAEIERLKAENSKLNRAKTGEVKNSIRLQVSAKGALSLYGLGRFPVTLYRSQWERLLSISSDIAQYIVDHKGELKEKSES
jgi:hypothetical protein